MMKTIKLSEGDLRFHATFSVSDMELAILEGATEPCHVVLLLKSESRRIPFRLDKVVYIQGRQGDEHALADAIASGGGCPIG